MLINTGSRTDIPAYYSEWFYNRIHEGYVCTRNPYYPNQVQRYRLSPDVVDCLIFCTKNPEPMLPRLNELEGFRQLWYVTITPYDKDIELYVPDKKSVINSLKTLSENRGADTVIWRYDPIFISDKYTLDFHLKTFEKMAAELEGYTYGSVISFIDLYAKTRRNFPQARPVNKEEREAIGESFAQTGKKHGITIYSCCEGTELEKYGVDVGGCMTRAVIERALGAVLNIPKKKPAREGCDCLLGNDIGMYNTCGHGCIYCYANYDRKTVEEQMKKHDKNSPFLIGGWREGDIVKDAKQESYFDGQLRLPMT